MKIGFIGFGGVGQANAEALKLLNEDLEFAVYDPAKGENRREDVANAEIVYVAVTTPEAPDGGIDSSVVEDAIAEHMASVSTVGRGKQVIVLCSTVPIGTTKKLAERHGQAEFVFHPEFMAVRKIQGLPLSSDQRIENRAPAEQVARLYEHASVSILITDSSAAECIKLAANCFLAMKVTFANELFDLCGKAGLDYETVKNGIGLDPRIGPSHMNVTDERGWGGGCFPRDIPEFIKFARSLDYTARLLTAVNQTNAEIRSGLKDGHTAG
jgi:UDPglucose 6-dehydrogenase